MEDVNISIPNNWGVRKHQEPLWDYMANGGKRAVAVWHRRAGKDSTSLNFTSVQAHIRKGVYWHLAPTAKQVRKIVWDNIDARGDRVIDQVFPEAVRTKTNQTEMRIELKCGSLWQCVGSDNFDSLVGANPVGVVFSEYALANPRAWDYIRPILAENGGWAIFIYTPRGKNHGYELYNFAKKNPKWYHEILTVGNTGVISEEIIQEERDSGMPEAMIEQEFYCSFDSPLVGAYYAREFNRINKEGRITRVPYDTGLQVHTAWDLGIGDATSIWFFQQIGFEIRVIDFYESSGVGLDHYVDHLRSKPYKYGEHYLPHDVNVRELSTGKARIDTLHDLGVHATVVPQLPVADGINAVRNLLGMCYFDEDKCHYGIEALKAYHAEYDDIRRVIKAVPVHDWASHAADAFRYAAIMLDPPTHKTKKFKTKRAVS